MTTKTTRSRDVIAGSQLNTAGVNKLVSDLQPEVGRMSSGPVPDVQRIEKFVADFDPWKHRSAGMTCGSCMWFVKKVNANNVPTHLGRCRRHAPTMSGYPVVFTHDWCGEHKLDENKL